MAYNGIVFAGSLTGINIAASGSLAVLGPLLAQVDLSLFGSVGLGSIQADLQAQLTGALQAQLNIGLNIVNPLAGFSIALSAIAVLQSQIAAALSGAIPVVTIEASAQISTLAAFSAALEVRIGALEAIIQGAISVKSPAVQFAGQLSAFLSAGPAFVLSYDGVTLTSAGSSIAADFASGLASGPNTILPGEMVYGIVLITKSPSVWTAIQATIKT